MPDDAPKSERAVSAHKSFTTLRSGFKVGARGGYFWWWRPGRTWVMRSRPATLRAKEDGPKGRWISLLEPPFELGAFLREVDHETLVMFGQRSLNSFPRDERPKRTPAGVIRRAAVRRFFEDVPHDVQAALKTFGSGTWPLFRLLMTSEPSRELMQTEDGARVAWLLAGMHRLKMVKDPLRRARRWASRKRRDALGLLGFPPTSSALSALTRVPRTDLTLWNVDQLRDVLVAPHLAERLRHLPRVPAVVFELLACSQHVDRISPALLHELSLETAIGPHRASFSIEVRETVNLLEEADMAVPIFSSLAHLRACHDRALAALSGSRTLQMVDEPFPPLPIALTPEEEGIITPLTDPRALLCEGNEMSHCLGKLPMHHALARRGEFYAFQIHKPERLTLAVHKVKGRWEFYDFKGPWNAPPREDTSFQVADGLLERFRIASESRRAPRDGMAESAP